MRERPAIKIRVEVVCSWFGCKKKKRLFTCSGRDYRGRTMAVDEEEVVIEGECWMRVLGREKDVRWRQINGVIWRELGWQCYEGWLWRSFLR